MQEIDWEPQPPLPPGALQREPDETGERELDLRDFFQECDGAHREFFSVVIRQWQSRGLPWIWVGRDVGLAGRAAEKEAPVVIFRLIPGRGTAPALISLDMEAWRNLFGFGETAEFIRSIEEIQGLEVKIRSPIYSIIDPGHASGPMQQDMRDAILLLGSRLIDLMGK